MWRFGKGVLVLLLVCMAGCKRPADMEQLPPGERVSIQYLKSFYRGYPLRLTRDYVLEGRVVSDDSRGNFRYSIIVEDDTGGIELKVGRERCSDLFPPGLRILVRCAGLVLGSYGGTLQLGGVSSDERYECGFIPQDRLSEHLSTSGTPGGGIQAAEPGPGEISMRYLHCRVRFREVQFIREDAGLPWGYGGGYTERRLQFCSSSDTLTVRTSPYAEFIAERIPEGSGTIEGVLTHFAGRFSLVVPAGEYARMDRERFDTD